MNSKRIDYTSIPRTSKLARYTTWNILGMTLPMAAALVAIPILIREMGTPRFGLLSLVWMLVGYFSIFDFGLGRALTKMTAGLLGQGKSSDVPTLFWTSMITMTVIGTLGAVVIAAISPWLAFSALKIVPELQAEARDAFLLSAVCTPVVITTVGLIGMLEAHQRFGILNAIRLPMGLFTFLGPLIVLPFTNHLPAVVGVLLVGRVVICALYFSASLRCNPDLRCKPVFDRSRLVPLFTFGGWITVSNMILPLILQIDRLLLGIWSSVVAVAYYTTSSEVIIKLLILPRSWVSTLFPVFAAHYHTNAQQTQALFSRSVKYLLLLLFPAILVVVALAHDGLRLWLNTEYADQSAPVMRILAISMLIASISYIPYSFLQAIGKPRLSAIAHIIELPVFAGCAWLLTREYGIAGMAYASLLRSLIDLILMFGFASRFLPDVRGSLVRLTFTAAPAGLSLWIAQLPPSLTHRAIVVAILLLAWAIYGWSSLLNKEERDAIKNRLGRGASGSPA